MLAVFEAEGGHYVPFFRLLADTGCRVGEACALLGRDVDRGRNEVRFRRTKTTPRTIAVSPEVMALIPTTAPSDHVFKSRRGNRMKPSTALDVFTRVKSKAGLGSAPLDVHSLRRSWITDAHRAGVPMAESMRQTGHRSPTVHLGYTAGAPTDRTHQAAEAVRSFRDRQPGPEKDDSTDTLTECHGERLQLPATKEVEGHSFSVWNPSNAPEAACIAALSQLTPRSRQRLRPLLGWLSGLGVAERAAIYSLTSDADLGAMQERLDQQ